MFTGRDEKECLPSTEKNAVVEVDRLHRPVETCSLKFSRSMYECWPLHFSRLMWMALFIIKTTLFMTHYTMGHEKSHRRRPQLFSRSMSTILLFSTGQRQPSCTFLLVDGQCLSALSMSISFYSLFHHALLTWFFFVNAGRLIVPTKHSWLYQTNNNSSDGKLGRTAEKHS